MDHALDLAESVSGSAETQQLRAAFVGTGGSVEQFYQLGERDDYRAVRSAQSWGGLKQVVLGSVGLGEGSGAGEFIGRSTVPSVTVG